MPTPIIVLDDGTRLAVAAGSRIAVTRQDNDLTKPDSIQSSYSSSFTLPDDAETHIALEYAAEGTAATSKPYEEIGCALDNGDGVELLPRSLLQVNGYNLGVGYDSQVYGGNRGFYSKLGDKKLRELNLERFSHNWNAGNIFAGLNRAADAYALGYCYDLVDRGKGTPAALNTTNNRRELEPFLGETYPSVFARALFDQIFAEAGHSWRGTIPESFNRLTLPAPIAFGYSQETRDSYAINAGYKYNGNDGGRHYTNEFTIVAKFNYLGGENRHAKGKLAEFNTASGTAKIKVPGYYNIRSGWRMAAECDSYLPGRVIAISELWKGGNGRPAVKVADDEFRTGSGDSAVLTCEFMNQLCEVGDEFFVLLLGREEGGAGPFDPAWYWGVNNNGGNNIPLDYVESENFFEVELLEKFPTNGQINLVDWLPDMTQKDFVKSIIYTYSLQQRPDPYLDVIEFHPSAELLDRLGVAPVWDGRRDARKPPLVKYQLPGSFGRQNWLKWKEDNSNPDTAKGLGDSAIPCPDLGLEASKDLLTMPFAASPVGDDGLPLIPKWALKSDSTDYSAQTPGPRLLVRSRTASRTVHGIGPAVGMTATVPLAYFAAGAESFDLDFARLIPTFYPVLSAALRAPRWLRDNVRLEPGEVVEFDQLTPVYIAAEGHYFYVNKIDQYESDNPTTSVELIRLSL